MNVGCCLFRSKKTIIVQEQKGKKNEKDEMQYVCDAGGWLEPVTKAVTEYVKKQIDAQPTVEAEPVSHGQWNYVTVVDEGFWRCSNCGTPSEAMGAKKLYKYCPFCGAKMREE